MTDTKLGPIETRFAQIIWENAPLGSGELVKLAQTELEWKKSTTYTVLKKLCDRGLFENRKGVITVLISKEEFDGMQSEQFVRETFEGSLPAFFAAFTKRKQLSAKEIQEIRQMIDAYEEK